MQRWLKEPLFHFILLGALIFGLYAQVNEEQGSSVEQQTILISSGEIGTLSQNWQKRWRRPPTEAELQGLIEARIREEVYYREAIALGLDQDDTILRRRLMQKLEFLTSDLAELQEPSEQELEEFFQQRLDKYRLPARASFAQVFFSLDQRGNQAYRLAEETLLLLQTSGPLEVSELGDSTLFPQTFRQQTAEQVEKTFGREFAKQLFALEAGSWQGPIRSAYGLHLVKVAEQDLGRAPKLSKVIEKVRNDWRFEQQKQVNQEIYQKFKERYQIVVEPLPSPSSSAALNDPNRRAS